MRPARARSTRRGTAARRARAGTRRAPRTSPAASPAPRGRDRRPVSRTVSSASAVSPAMLARAPASPARRVRAGKPAAQRPQPADAARPERIGARTPQVAHGVARARVDRAESASRRLLRRVRRRARRPAGLELALQPHQRRPPFHDARRSTSTVVGDSSAGANPRDGLHVRLVHLAVAREPADQRLPDAHLEHARRRGEQQRRAGHRGQPRPPRRQPQRARAHRAAASARSASPRRRARRGPRGPGRLRPERRSPTIASSAGTNVTAIASAISTASATPGPNVWKNPSCATSKAALAPATVTPAATIVGASSPVAVRAAATRRQPLRQAQAEAREEEDRVVGEDPEQEHDHHRLHLVGHRDAEAPARPRDHPDADQVRERDRGDRHQRGQQRAVVHADGHDHDQHRAAARRAAGARRSAATAPRAPRSRPSPL